LITQRSGTETNYHATAGEYLRKHRLDPRKTRQRFYQQLIPGKPVWRQWRRSVRVPHIYDGTVNTKKFLRTETMRGVYRIIPADFPEEICIELSASCPNLSGVADFSGIYASRGFDAAGVCLEQEAPGSAGTTPKLLQSLFTNLPPGWRVCA